MNIHDNMVSIQPPEIGRYDLIMLQKTGNDSIRSAAIWMQPKYVTASELLVNPHSDTESDRTSELESIKDYRYDKTDYEDSSDNESITDMDKQLKQLEVKSRSLSKTLDERIDNLKVRMRDNNMIRRQKAEIHSWLNYKFDELIESMEAERRTILEKDTLHTI